jgi:hypothetical protein
LEEPNLEEKEEEVRTAAKRPEPDAFNQE